MFLQSIPDYVLRKSVPKHHHLMSLSSPFSFIQSNKIEGRIDESNI